MISILTFFLGTLVGTIFGVFLAGAIVLAKQADERADKNNEHLADRDFDEEEMLNPGRRELRSNRST
jgi:hypothetical protein